MTFDDVLTQVLELLQREKRVSYRALKVRFQLDDDLLEAVKDELIYAKKLAVDEENRVLVWVGGQAAASAPPPVPGTPALASAPASDHEPAPLSYTPQHLAEKILTSRSALEGERKQVTVLFADLKGSTELIRDLDPEAAQHLLDPALQHMMDAVHRFEGTVNQVLGDGIMALFGAPVAHEDHAVRACYAALAMQTALRRYAEEVRHSHGLEMQMRVGLNSGEVVVRAISNDLHMDYSAVGQTTHLAARMEQLATPGSIRLTAATLRLAEGLVQVNALGQFPVKGLTEPVEVFELVGASAIRRRLQASAARGLTRFVGRQQELVALQQALEQAGAGHGQVVALVGEAGLGKSRLAYEFVHSHYTPGWLVLESASVSYGKATPYYPVIDLLKRYSHVEEGDDTRTIRAKVTGQVLTLDPVLQDTVPALLSLLDALPEDSPFVQLDPPQRRQRTLDALKRVLLRESQVQPLLLVFEDLHWIGQRNAIPARQLGGEPAHGAAAAPGQLPARVPARLGQQDLLHATAARPAATSERRRVLAGPPGGRSQSGTAQTPADRAYRGQSLLPGRERAHPGGDRGTSRGDGCLSPGTSHSDRAGASDGAGGVGSTYRPIATRGEASLADGCRDWHRGTPPLTVRHRRVAGRRSAARPDALASSGVSV
jgi:class 3 adenylate cyclase